MCQTDWIKSQSSQSYYLLAVWPWVSYLPLCASVLTGQSPFLRSSLPELAGPHRAWLTLIVLWAFILRTRKLLEAPWRRGGSRNLQVAAQLKHPVLQPPHYPIKALTPPEWCISLKLVLSLPWESKNKTFNFCKNKTKEQQQKKMLSQFSF